MSWGNILLSEFKQLWIFNTGLSVIGSCLLIIVDFWKNNDQWLNLCLLDLVTIEVKAKLF